MPDGSIVNADKGNLLSDASQAGSMLLGGRFR